MSRLKGKVCVVNGVASTIGQAVAERFAVEGGVVVGVDKVAHNVVTLRCKRTLRTSRRSCRRTSRFCAGTSGWR
ncbi:MAG: hypothetical protein QOH97_5808 [Actinoplanes sp.]|jgi:NAD(P)-dependent dehydrogenase (short-subunit alcohol dehydrogenase family)|nr:hypothetical protein [Actinoplanes sp.]